ncbi:strigolactone esterase D14 [Spatholobus suberectus]|nr:strigolactone esterase D14 [Spatholobus suberectus]
MGTTCGYGGGTVNALNANFYGNSTQTLVLAHRFGTDQINFSGWAYNFAPNAINVNNPAAIVEFEHSLLRMKPKVALSVAKIVFLSYLIWVLPRVHVPFTIIQTKKDLIVLVSIAFYLNINLGTLSKVKNLETQGHFPQLTAYRLLLEVLKDSLSMN